MSEITKIVGRCEKEFHRLERETLSQQAFSNDAARAIVLLLGDIAESLQVIAGGLRK